ncbi:hypothetical protein COT51_01920 [candidate division WWE3 bacterium CG08_land_8_20_14_0_20_41_15]|uniref:Cell division protein FtsL n=1 Tax=candidate division WWE3 bacterium CG08_land_8_20_14_0_20_41_15 TaxID=1975086 RepID=A0A2H0X9Y1_UNCKA|nr:MAG: hypothetical protein COT51_01920 [candidate division WWE3 bacterium CG08_land_8_20_14_0_20_41_15]
MVKKTARIAIIAFALATVGRIVAVNCFCADGGELRATEARKETLERENLILREELAEKISLKKIEARAKALGMVKFSQVDYVANPVVASR